MHMIPEKPLGHGGRRGRRKNVLVHFFEQLETRELLSSTGAVFALHGGHRTHKPKGKPTAGVHLSLGSAVVGVSSVHSPAIELTGGASMQTSVDTVTPATVATFAHPGILSTDADYLRMKTEVAAGAQPWLQAWNNLQADGYAHLGVSPRPLQTVVRAGTGSNYAQMFNDIRRAYDTALEWKISGDTRYADQTVTFLNAWASTNTSITGDTNASLAYGLYGFQWANIAEMMRTYTGWAAADQTQFQNYLLNVYIPGNQDLLVNHHGTDPTHYWANWDLCNIASEMAIGVFCDRHDLYDAGLNYLYNGIGNGALDKAIYYMQPGNLGQGQEEGRDQGHSGLDYALLGEICQMAWNQGDDLFSYKNNEILAGVEYFAKYNLGNDVPFTTYGSSTGGTETGISGGARGNLRPMLELFYNHYVVMEGLSAPYTTQAVLQHTRPEGDYGNGDEYSDGTLIFALDPLTTVMPPQSLVGYEKGTGNIQLNWWGGANDNTYNVYRATSSTGPFTKIASGITNFTYTDENLPAGTYYYKVTGVNGTTETAATNLIQTLSGNALISQLKFDQSSGTTASDSVGNLTGTLNGGATFVPGKSGNALSFDGSSGYVSLSAGAISNLSDYTIATWVYLNGAPSTWARIFDFGDSRGDWMFLTANAGGGTLEFATGTTYNYNKQSIDAPALPTNQWVHVAVTFSNRLATLYVNGVAVGSNANMNFPPYEINGGMPNNWIGRSQYSSDPYLNAKIDDFRIYNGAMSTAQVYTLARGNAAPTVPTAPATLSAATPPGNQINLAWASVAGATSYSVYRSGTSGGPYVPIATLISGTSYSNTGLTAGTTYYYVVTAADNGGDGALSPEASAVALPPMPAVPTSLTAKGISATSNGLSWTAASNAYTYDIYRSVTSGGPYTLLASGITGTTYTDTGLASGTTYDYVVTASNASGQSSNSNEATCTPSSLYLDIPFDEDAGTAAGDSSGNGWNGTLINGATWTAGKSGSAVNLAAASSQYVSLPAGVMSPLTNFTISAWVNLQSINTWMRIFDFGTGTSDYMFLSPKGGSNVVRFAITTGGGSGEQQINGSAALPTGVWTHVAVTLNGHVGTLYVNGTAVGSNNNMTLNPASLGSTTLNYLGKSQFSDPYFDGMLDDFRIYSTALSASQIQALAQGASPSATGFIVNNGAAQRSMVTSLTVTFNQPVTLATGAMALVQTSDNTVIPVTISTNDDMTYQLTFSGSGVIAGSLADGLYSLKVTSADVTAAGVAMSSDAAFAFDRLFGDFNGDGTVDSLDSLNFRKDLGAAAGAPNYFWYMDYDGSGTIDSIDSLHLRLNMGKSFAP